MKRATSTLMACTLSLSFAWPQAEEPAAIGPDDARLLCDATEVIECWPDGECTQGTAESVGLPHFVRLDLDGMELSSPSPGFQDLDSATIESLDRTDGRIALTGDGRNGRTWSLLISEQTGAMNGAVLAGGFSFLVFGACVVYE